MDPAQRLQVQSALREIGVDDTQFEVEEIDGLFKAGYRTPRRLKIARRQGLRDAGLRPASIDEILHAQGGGAGGGAAATGAVASADPGSSAAAGDLDAFSSAVLKNVAGLKLNDKTIGTVCFLVFKGMRLILAARHCLDPQAGRPIDTAGLTAFGVKIVHLASFPKFDVSVLKLSDDAPLENITPFELAGEMGLARCQKITLAAYPMVADESVPNFVEANEPILSRGRVSWFSGGGEIALGDYGATFPNSSGAPVMLHVTVLAGMHVGTISHEEGENPFDTAAPRDHRAAISTAAATSTGGGRGQSLPNAVSMETDTWSTGSEVPYSSALTNKRRRLSAGVSGAALEYAVHNVQHKSSMGCFVPAQTLHRLLLELPQL